MKNIFIIRHGETELNRKGIVQGSGVDTHLNELGQKQAQSFFARYHAEPFEVVLTSALRRTHQTVQGFIEMGIPWEQWAEINEISWGIHEGKVNTPQMHQEYTTMTNAWQKGDYTAKINGGESAQELANRIQLFVEHLKGRAEKNILVCSHGRAMRCLMCLLREMPLYKMDHFKHANTGLYKVLFDGNVFHFELNNNLSHLELIPTV